MTVVTSGGVAARGLIVLALLPLVILASTAPASAAPIYSEWVPGSFETGGWDMGKTQCNVIGRWVVDDADHASIEVQANCSQAWGAEANGTDINTLTALGSSGCTGLSNIPPDDPEGEWTLSLNEGAFFDAETCTVSQGQAQVCSDMISGGEDCTTLTFSWPVGPVPTRDVVETGTCAYGDVDRPTANTPLAAPYWWSKDSRWVRGESFRAYVTPSGSTGDGRWSTYLIWEHTPDSDWGTATKQVTAGEFVPVVGTPSHRDNFLDEGWTGGFTNNGGPPNGNAYVEKQQRKVVGVGIFRGPVSGGNASVPNGDPAKDLGLAGVTDPSRCAFYWGKKVAQFSAVWSDASQADPISTLDPAPPGTGLEEPTEGTPDRPAEQGCGEFSFLDPTTWASGGVCALVQAVLRLIDVVGSLPAAIWGLIEEGLSALFVPDDGFLDGKLQDVKDAWADTAPMVFIDGLQDLGSAFVISNPGTGCEGPELAFDSPVGGPVSLRPLSACGAAMANLASLVKVALTVGVYVGGFLTAARIVGAALGLDVSLGGSGRGADV